MRLAVLNLTSGGMSGGYRKYLTRMMPLLGRDPRISSLTVFMPETVDLALPGLDVRTWPAADRRLSQLRREVAVVAPDVIFIPTARYVTFRSTPVVVMVRNMEPLEVPFGGNTWTEGAKNLARAWTARRACRRASRVIAVSDHVRQFILSRWHLDPARVATVYHGVDSGARSGRAVDAPRTRTLFTAGSLRPARGLEDLIEALALVDADVRLVIAGRADPGSQGYADRLRRMCTARGLADRVRFAGHLGAAELSEAFGTAAAFVMTSRAEACPNTALEAMSFGAPIVSVNRPPMPEFFGEAALYYPVANPTALAGQLRAILSDDALRDRLAAAALRRAADFRWDVTRDRTIEELERAR